MVGNTSVLSLLFLGTSGQYIIEFKAQIKNKGGGGKRQGKFSLNEMQIFVF